MQFWPPDDEQMCSKYVEVWTKLIVKQKFYASSWLITEMKKLTMFTVKQNLIFGILKSYFSKYLE